MSTQSSTIEVRLASPEDRDFIKLTIASMLPNALAYGETWLGEWIDWFIAEKFCGVLFEDNELKAVCMGRPVFDADKAGEDHFYFDRSGDIVFVDAFVGEDYSRMSKCWNLALTVFGKQKKIAFNRCPRDRSVRVFPSDCIDRFMGITKGGSYG